MLECQYHQCFVLNYQDTGPTRCPLTCALIASRHCLALPVRRPIRGASRRFRKVCRSAPLPSPVARPCGWLGPPGRHGGRLRRPRDRHPGRQSRPRDFVPHSAARAPIRCSAGVRVTPACSAPFTHPSAAPPRLLRRRP
jgi:hypothetical protein